MFEVVISFAGPTGVRTIACRDDPSKGCEGQNFVACQKKEAKSTNSLTLQMCAHFYKANFDFLGTKEKNAMWYIYEVKYTFTKDGYFFVSFTIFVYFVDNLVYYLLIKGAMSRNFKQFRHWPTGHRINWNITITAWNCRRTQKKHRKAKKWNGWENFEKIRTDCVRINLKKVGPTFFKFISICMKVSFTMLANHSCLLCGSDFANKRLLLCQFEV